MPGLILISFNPPVWRADFGRISRKFLKSSVPLEVQISSRGCEQHLGVFGADCLLCVFPECNYGPTAALGRQNMLALFPKYCSAFLNDRI